MSSSPRRLFLALSLALAGALPATACATSPASPADAGPDVETIGAARDAARPEAPTGVDAKTRWDRMGPHDGRVLASMRLEVVYLGFEGDDGAPSFDDFIDWLLSSEYWAIMKQYGVGPGRRVGSVRVAARTMIPPWLVKNGLIMADDLEGLVHDAIHGGLSSSDDAGVSADTGDDASSDASPDVVDPPDAPSGPLVPRADAYIVFLPFGVNVNIGSRAGRVYQTCIDAGGYHSFDGDEPYAIIPPCTSGRSPLAVSHELAEMATDPFPNAGWYSDADSASNGGEVGDLCNMPATHGADGWGVTQLWSNADGDCEPN